MSKYKVGDRLKLEVVGTVTKEHELYVELSVDDSDSVWTVEDDDPEWVTLDEEPVPGVTIELQMTEVDPDWVAMLYGHACPEPPKRTQRELELESALIEAVSSFEVLIEQGAIKKAHRATALRWLNESDAELLRLQKGCRKG